MGFYRECPYCGVNLDPGERCECTEAERNREDIAEIVQQLKPDIREWLIMGLRNSEY